MCSICLQGLGSCGMMIQCGHLFHERCVTKWFREGSLTCPVCRARLNRRDLIDIMTTAQHHRMYAYEQLSNTLIPSVYYVAEGENDRWFLKKDAGCRCVYCRGPITDIFELFIGSGICRHFFHESCATDFFVETAGAAAAESTEPFDELKRIEKMLVETDYCPYCIEPLDTNGIKRLEHMRRIASCREHL